MGQFRKNVIESILVLPNCTSLEWSPGKSSDASQTELLQESTEQSKFFNLYNTRINSLAASV